MTRGRAVLPQGAAEFLRCRLTEAVGLALIAAAAAGLAALASYTPGDPSFNSTGGGISRNLLSAPGAHGADIMIQALGAAAMAPALVIAAWGWRMVRKSGVSMVWLRLMALLAAMVFLASGLAALPQPGMFPLVSGSGGVIGTLALTHAGAYLGPHGVVEWALASASAVLGSVLLIAALGITWSEWRAAGSAAGRAIGALARALAWSFRLVLRLLWRLASPPRLDPAAEPSLDVPAVQTPKAAAKRRRRKAPLGAHQGVLELTSDGTYSPPPLRLLEPAPRASGRVTPSKDDLEHNSRFLTSVLEEFGVLGDMVSVSPGPVVTLYELEPAPGTKTSRVIGLADDIARSMSAVSVRIAVVPGRNVIGIELPNASREMVALRDLLEAEALGRMAGTLTLALGKDIAGAPVMVDLERMPHLLIAGTTGSGKSVAMNTMILSLLYQLSPDQCRFIMIDPKMLELSVYDGIPHLLTPVVTDPRKAVTALKWAVREMEERYRAMSNMGARDITGYNTRLAEAVAKGETITRRVQTGFDEAGMPVFEEQPLSMEPLPFIVVVVDEMADLMMVAGKDIEAAVQRLSQMARAAGIHLIMATQRPSVDVITGTIKANFPTRVSFQVTSKVDSRTILGEQGAEQLLGQGDMLYMAGGGRITRVHGPYVSVEEVEGVVEYLKTQGEPDYIETVTEEPEETASPMAGAGDEYYDKAVALIAREGKASTSFIQRHLQIGYNRAARIIERMEAEGVVSQANRVGRREVLIGSASS